MTTWGRGNYSLRTSQWRYTRYFDGTEELYHKSHDPNEWTNVAGNPEYAALKKDLADKWLPKSEAPQVVSGRELYNVWDADSPARAVESYKRKVQELERVNLEPSPE